MCGMHAATTQHHGQTRQHKIPLPPTKKRTPSLAVIAISLQRPPAMIEIPSSSPRSLGTIEVTSSSPHTTGSIGLTHLSSRLIGSTGFINNPSPALGPGTFSGASHNSVPGPHYSRSLVSHFGFDAPRAPVTGSHSHYTTQYTDRTSIPRVDSPDLEAGAPCLRCVEVQGKLDALM